MQYSISLRFVLRTSLLGAFALFSRQGFAATMPTLMWFSAGYCVGAGMVRCTPILASRLTDWDEAVAYLAAGSAICLIRDLSA